MIPMIEDFIIQEIERRVTEAMPETSESDSGDAETFVVSFESRKFTPCLQEQENLTVYGEVSAEISVVFFSQKKRYDYSPLYVSLTKKPFIQLADELAAHISLDRCEAVEGPYLSNDAWLIKAKYYVFETEGACEWQPPRIGTEDVSAPDLYPMQEPDESHAPEKII
jgi:hypothetical protein